MALSNAWQTGAQQLTMAQRADLANDPINLQATDGPTNQQKGDGDAATWLPPNKSYRCTYVARQIAVKSSYRLWVTPAETDAITRVLATCTNTPAPPATSTPDTTASTSSTTSSTTAPPPAATATAADPTTPDPTTPDPTTADPSTADPTTADSTTAAATTPAADAGTGNSSYYRNCAAAKAACAAPLYRGQPGYRPGLDRDSDGIACEK